MEVRYFRRFQLRGHPSRQQNPIVTDTTTDFAGSGMSAMSLCMLKLCVTPITCHAYQISYAQCPSKSIMPKIYPREPVGYRAFPEVRGWGRTYIIS